MASDQPVQDTIAQMTAASIENCQLDPREFMLVRLAALAAAGAPPVSYLANAATAARALGFAVAVAELDEA